MVSEEKIKLKRSKLNNKAQVKHTFILIGISSYFFIYNRTYLGTFFKFIFAVVLLYYDIIYTLNVFTTQDLRYKLLHEVAVVFLKRKIRLSDTCMSLKDHDMVYQLYYKTI